MRVLETYDSVHAMATYIFIGSDGEAEAGIIQADGSVLHVVLENDEM